MSPCNWPGEEIEVYLDQADCPPQILTVDQILTALRFELSAQPPAGAEQTGRIEELLRDCRQHGCTPMVAKPPPAPPEELTLPQHKEHLASAYEAVFPCDKIPPDWEVTWNTVEAELEHGGMGGDPPPPPPPHRGILRELPERPELPGTIDRSFPFDCDFSRLPAPIQQAIHTLVFHFESHDSESWERWCECLTNLIEARKKSRSDEAREQERGARREYRARRKDREHEA